MRQILIDSIVRELLASPLGGVVASNVRDGYFAGGLQCGCGCLSCEARRGNLAHFADLIRARYRALSESRPAAT